MSIGNTTRIAGLAAVLLCVPVEAQRVSIGDLATDVEGKPQLRFVELVGRVLDGNTGGFQISITCSDDFALRTLIITARDATAVDIIYNRASLVGSAFFGGALAPPANWEVAQEDFTVRIGPASPGHELMSSMKMPALGLVGGATFAVIGNRTPNTQATTMTIGAVVETSSADDNDCQIILGDA